LERTGIKKCVILNSHGGNAFKGLIRELYGQTSVHLFVCNWYAIKDGYDEIFEAKEDHAGELETSILLHARPDLVHLSRADDGATRPLRFEALRNGWIEVSRPWHLLTTNSGSGCPHRATAEKGKKWLDILVDRLATFLVELSASPIDDSFPFEPKGTK
jgi:creatinine amidohydrolase